MKFKVSSNLEYRINTSATLILNIQACRNRTQTILQESLAIEPELASEEFTSATNARYIRLYLPEPGNFNIKYDAVVDVTPRIVDTDKLNDFVGLNHIDGEIIPYLFPSRYCQSDKLYRFAFGEFGNAGNIYQQVCAISDWIYNKIKYVSGSTNANTSAYDTITERAGVCRDFAHLGITLCRALSIPARYFAGYAYKLNPPDFHACFEAYIGNEWVFFDATKLAPVNSMVKIAHGVDASNTSVASIFGSAELISSFVACEAPEQGFTELILPEADTAISYG